VRRVGLLLWLLPLALPGCESAKDAAAREFLSRARAVLEKGGEEPSPELWKEARFLLQEALALAPDLAEARLLFARAWLVGGDYARALKEAGLVPPNHPQNAVTRALASAALYRLRADPILAEDALVALSEAGDAIAPGQKFEVARDLVNCPGERGQGRAYGIKVLLELVGSESPVPAAWEATLGVALYMAGRKSEAASHLRRALEDPSVPGAEALEGLLRTIE